ncbi:MAG TPA: hypothetical protein VN871_10420 [Mycobacterium sp.]|nr:hypothetical protein [Mycobacterium sp.]
MGTDIDIFYIGRIEIRSSVTGEPVGSVAEDTVRTVCPQNGAEQVLDTRNGLPKTRRHRQRHV